jgi:hypothetical protein
MPGFLVQVGAQIMCPHGGGQVQIAPTQARVTLGGQPAATLTDPCTVAGCPYQDMSTSVPVPMPCVNVQWLVGATRVTIGGQPALLGTSTGTCIGSSAPGPPTVAMTQSRVRGA